MLESSAAKGLFRFADGDAESYLFVAGRRGRMNLPGGGIDPFEESIDALRREIKEEIGAVDLEDIHEIGEVIDIVTPQCGPPMQRRWHVFGGVIGGTIDDIRLPDGSEIIDFDTFTPTECLNYQYMSRLAQRAMMLSPVAVNAR